MGLVRAAVEKVEKAVGKLAGVGAGASCSGGKKRKRGEDDVGGEEEEEEENGGNPLTG